jgi:arylsulfatase
MCSLRVGSPPRENRPEPVTDGYAGDRPWAFTGGEITRVAIDVSGDALVDLAKEAAAAFARQ